MSIIITEEDALSKDANNYTFVMPEAIGSTLTEYISLPLRKSKRPVLSLNSYEVMP